MPSSSMTKTSVHTNDENSVKHSHDKSCRRMYYPSNNKGSSIVNAITGETYRWKNGTIDALRLFRVVDSTGTCDSHGYYDRRGNHSDTSNKEPNVLYYDGPNEYMNHRKTKVDPALISEWNETRGQLFTDGELNLNAYHQLKSCGKIRASIKA